VEGRRGTAEDRTLRDPKLGGQLTLRTSLEKGQAIEGFGGRKPILVWGLWEGGAD